MSDMHSVFSDQSGKPGQSIDLWPPIVITREQIDLEIARLGALPAPANGVRRAWIVHPNAVAPGLGLAPGIRVMLDVLLPGERSKPVRHNSTNVNFCIRGAGSALIGTKRFEFGLHDVWNTPSMVPYAHVNTTDAVQARLTYSNAALLEKMNVHEIDDQVDEAALVADGTPSSTGPEHSQDPRKQNPFGTFEMRDGAYLMPYERLISPDPVDNTPLFWRWEEVKAHLDKLEALGADYAGRRLYLLYNPATGRTNGTTHNFFATMCLRPPKIVDRPHRHTAAAINYYFQGSGYSVVEGKRYEWQAGDLMLSAPGWGIHNHASYDEPVYELTIQDSPLNITMESLLWQENLRQPLAVLGAQAGFETNRKAVGV